MAPSLFRRIRSVVRRCIRGTGMCLWWGGRGQRLGGLVLLTRSHCALVPLVQLRGMGVIYVGYHTRPGKPHDGHLLVASDNEGHIGATVYPATMWLGSRS